MNNMVRIVTALDVKDGRVVKGVQFKGLQDAGDPASAAAQYGESGADEVMVLDVAAGQQGRGPDLALAKRVLEATRAPVSFGGGITSLEDARALHSLGISRVLLSTAAVEEPDLLKEISTAFGSDFLALSLDVKRVDGATPALYQVMTHGGTHSTGINAVGFAACAEEQGVGAILVNSVDQDGVREGFDLELLEAISGAVNVPVIASGGAGKAEHFVDAAKHGAQGVLGASIFHFGHATVPEVKKALSEAGFGVES